MAQMVIELGANVFTIGLRLALPILGLLLMTEIALALVGRMTTQLQSGAERDAAQNVVNVDYARTAAEDCAATLFRLRGADFPARFATDCSSKRAWRTTRARNRPRNG